MVHHGTLGRMNMAIEKIRALYLAELHFKEARSVCELLISQSRQAISHELIWGLYTGIVISYARSFGQNDGLSRIGSAFSRFDDQKQQALHDRLLSVRNTIYAHRDMLRDSEHLAPQFGVEEIKRIRIEVGVDGRVGWSIARPGLALEYAADILALCDFQIGSVAAASAGMLAHFAAGKSFAPGGYILGENFP